MIVSHGVRNYDLGAFAPKFTEFSSLPPKIEENFTLMQFEPFPEVFVQPKFSTGFIQK